MNRTKYFNYIEQKLGALAYSITQRGKLNILDYHNHSENFYVYLMNCIYGLNFSNANKFKQNVEAIDLIDTTNKIIVQVSATNTKAKVTGALSKPLLLKHPGYTFKFISIAKECTDLRKDTFSPPVGIAFSTKTDIIDNKTILDHILMLDIDTQKNVYELIKAELGDEPNIVKLDTNLAVIINILAQDDLKTPSKMVVDSFEIDRKIDHNSLAASRQIIEEYATYYARVDKKYVEFDTMGVNKSVSVLASINKCYVDAVIKNPKDSADQIFYKVIDNVSNKVLESSNFVGIPLDELELCVSVLVVDAFIRCKIFKNPKDYQYAIA
jgi:hypothetical protein